MTLRDQPLIVGARWLGRLPARLRESLWFVPMLVVLGSVGLALLMLWLDSRVSRTALERFPHLFGADAQSERTMLGAIASSMITVAGVTFSITMVAVAQAANQFTSRVLGSFMRDRTNQLVLGVFAGVFAYCLVIMRTIRGEEEIRFVPSLSVMLAFLLALVAIGFLIYFVHHVAQSLQSSTVLAGIRADTERAIDRLFPEELDEHAADLAPARDAGADDAGWNSLPSRATGYIESVHTGSLERAARHLGTVIRMERGVGDFVVEGEPLASTARSGLRDSEQRAIANAFTIGRSRTVDQDPAYGIRQLVDVALKALSPASNDTTTAVRCVDHISALLCRLVNRRTDSGSESAGLAAPGIITCSPSFDSMLAAGFDQIRRSAASNIAVLARQVRALERIGGFARVPARRRRVLDQLDLISAQALQSLPAGPEREALLRRCDRARAALARDAGRLPELDGGAIPVAPHRARGPSV